MSRIALLGPQRYDPTVGRVADELGMHGPVATINSGWQEREPDDGELDELLGGRSRNLHLYGRWLDVARRDPELAEANARRRETVEEIQAVYLVRLHHALQSVTDLHSRTGDPDVLAAAVEDATRAVTDLDAWHLQQVADVHATYTQRWQPFERRAVAEHRGEVARILGSVSGVVIAGGHVAVLLHGLRLFGVGEHVRELPIVAWSAGAMALTDIVVLFHDRAVHRVRHAEVLGGGLHVVRALVALPHARRRLDLADRRRTRILARRFAPARCLLLDDGVDVRLLPDGSLPDDAPVIGMDGEVPDVA